MCFRTVTVSVISTGCKEQKIRYVPGRVNRNLNLRPWLRFADANPWGPLASVTLWSVPGAKSQLSVESGVTDALAVEK